jgi:hypothetical protein
VSLVYLLQADFVACPSVLFYHPQDIINYRVLTSLQVSKVNNVVFTELTASLVHVLLANYVYPYNFPSLGTHFAADSVAFVYELTVSAMDLNLSRVC